MIALIVLLEIVLIIRSALNISALQLELKKEPQLLAAPNPYKENYQWIKGLF